MKLYSDFGPRRTRQIVADVFAIATIAAWAWLGSAVYRAVKVLGDFGEQMEDAGAGFRETMVDVGSTLGGIPIIGGGIRVPFDGASDAGAALEAAGQSQQEAVNQLALTLGIGIAALPIVMILLVWLVPRIRFATDARRARQVLSSEAGIDLLALRALANQNVAALASVDGNPMAAWRRGDETVMRALAALELRSAGVRLPT